VDTRVMQVIYSFNQADLHVFPGQLMDVYIEDTAHQVVKPAGPEPPVKKK
jgi:hypothetical protein